ncbi:hypothetical protein M407DRAFT_29433 [Tulasnella calospora MUT 4182]|uniref:Uncharacterized protein n=1 Tax=Tulasnella calospora MUT 4182 TaxID=1051891 RepID=A0A0C3QA49_9AGAM|nr:hypothetical protein M407DRAFT_29433 [Tulasnella calospora MUT 4182]
MQNHEHGPADGFGAPWSKHDDSSSRVQLSANMTHRLEKLARLRIDPSRIKFPEDGRKYEGGYATVSRGFLASSPDDTKEQVLELNVGSLTSGYRPVMTEGDNEGRGAAGCDAERKPRNEVVAQEREQELDGETSGRREVSES